MAELADNLPAAIAALSELAGQGDSAFGEAGHLAAVAGEAGRVRQRTAAAGYRGAPDAAVIRPHSNPATRVAQRNGSDLE
jgi:hypothetical protein